MACNRQPSPSLPNAFLPLLREPLVLRRLTGLADEWMLGDPSPLCRMSYTESQLLPGEHIKYQARLHWLPFLPAYFFGGLAALAAVAGLSMQSWALAIMQFALAAVLLLWAYITQSTSEFSVTDKRVIIKVGWIRRRTLETMLGKVEGIGVEQGLIGRLFNFGTIIVAGTGGTKEPFRNISRPLEFRHHVQSEVSSAEDRRQVVLPPGASPSLGIASSATREREERECPHCAEMILKKARVCKHCQREVLALPL